MSGLNLDEVGSEKVRAILTSEKGRDIFDLYYLIHNKEIKFNVELVNGKLAFYGISFDSEQFLQELGTRSKLYSTEMKPLVFGKIPDFDQVESSIEKWLASY